MLTCKGEDAMWQAFRTIRCARTMLLQEEGSVPVFQPVVLQQPKNGLEAGTLILYTQKILSGAMTVSTVLSVRGGRDLDSIEGLALQVMDSVRDKGCCAIDTRGRPAALACIKAIVLARRYLLRHQLDLALVLDPTVSDVPRGDGRTTLHNRFVVLKCEVNKPGHIRSAVAIRMRSAR